jgi:hypothetical protein
MLPALGTALDDGEEEGDGAAGQFAQGDPSVHLAHVLLIALSHGVLPNSLTYRKPVVHELRNVDSVPDATLISS